MFEIKSNDMDGDDIVRLMQNIELSEVEIYDKLIQKFDEEELYK